MESKYTKQDRGGKDEYQKYLDAMDAVSIEKVASATTFFEPKRGNTIVDVGMASGTSSAILAGLYPQMNILGVDINPKMVEIAAQNYTADNLSFRIDDGETLTSFENGSVNGFFNCSSIHHITSYNGYDRNRALNTLRRQEELLADRGAIVVRDFVMPQEKEVILELSTALHPDRPSDSELLVMFSSQARSLSSAAERGFPLVEIENNSPTTRRFRLFLSDATEYIRRKDYYNNWDVELQEEYGYFTQAEFEQIFSNLGLRIILSSPVYNRWIVNNRYNGQFRIFDLNGEVIYFPPTNYLIAGEKVIGGKHISLTRHLPQKEIPFLKHSSYINKSTCEIYDLVSRPNEVVDLIPYYKEDDRIFVLAKHAYPRPLTTLSGINNIDGKYYSGYITEGLTAGKEDDLRSILESRFGMSLDSYPVTVHGLNYYTSPGGVNEKISSYFVELTNSSYQSQELPNGFSGFKESGFIESFDAEQLLKSAQTGALPEARLEINVYRLFEQQEVDLPQWFGEKIEPGEGFDCEASNLNDLLDMTCSVFEPSDKTTAFLKSQRAVFSEIGRDGSYHAMEYVTPEKLSCNTLVTLPVNMINGELFVGLELRSLPVPQNHTGNSYLLTAPAKRLPHNVSDLMALEKFILGTNVGDAAVSKFFKLGEKYFPSIGITPEQVYPYVVSLDSATNTLKWVKAADLFANLRRIEDAHLLISLMRLRHAMNM